MDNLGMDTERREPFDWFIKNIAPWCIAGIVWMTVFPLSGLAAQSAAAENWGGFMLNAVLTLVFIVGGGFTAWGLRKCWGEETD
jgi:hypothetical protein